MAGSQLKRLKASLKENGLIGQTNIKRKNQKSKTPSETRKSNEKKAKLLDNIRSEFNLFDTKVNRNKHDFTVIQGGKFVKAGSKQHNQATKSRSNVEKSLQVEYDLNKRTHGRTGGIKDRRFGENDKNLSQEEKMLARFTKERQSASKGKKNVFPLSDDEANDYDDDDDDDGFTLTHSGRSLTFDDEENLGSGGAKFYDEDQLMPSDEAPTKKKSKHEVMQEIIAKSKFYKRQRQQEFEKAQEEIMDLDDEFGDIMGEINQSIVQNGKIAPQFLTKTQEEIEYDSKVRELTYDRRSVPADRTKTDEEVAKEHEDKMKKLEADRLKRMEGFVDEREAEGDDLDEDFWGVDASDNEGVEIEGSEAEQEDEESEEEDEEEDNKAPKFGRTLPRAVAVTMPSNQEEFKLLLDKIEGDDKQIEYIKKIVDTYKPNLAEGNKEKMNQFVSILFEHILVSSNEPNANQARIEKLIKVLKKLAEAYNQSMVETAREEINNIQSRIIAQSILKQDLVFFVLVGILFSTSDHYHLVVTPSLILMNEILSTSLVYDSSLINQQTINSISQGVFIIDLLLNYQHFAKRFDPEIVNFLEKSFILLMPEPTKMKSSDQLLSTNKVFASSINLSGKVTSDELSISIDQLFGEVDEKFKFQLLSKMITIVDKLVLLWKDKSSINSLIQPFKVILKHLIKYYANDSPKIATVLNKLIKIESNYSTVPLTLQSHKSLAIPTLTPKFEENFNPNKKSYDTNVLRQEVNKMKSQLKKERKSLVKDIRQQTKFNARQQIDEKKKMYDEYHKKMANIVNSISTVEGAEKNQYDRERKQRKRK